MSGSCIAIGIILTAIVVLIYVGSKQGNTDTEAGKDDNAWKPIPNPYTPGHVEEDGSITGDNGEKWDSTGKRLR